MLKISPRARPAPPTDPVALVLSAFLPYRLSIVSEIVSRTFASHYERRFNINIHEWRVIAVLGEAGSLSTQGVIERTQMDRVRVSRAVIRLGDKGFIARRSHPDDQRAKLLRLNPRGDRIYREIVPLALALQAQLVELLTPAEHVTLGRLLSKLQAGAGRLTSAREDFGCPASAGSRHDRPVRR